MKIPSSKIDELLSVCDITDIISEYTQLRKSGKNFMGRCPFHEERTPSFSVSQEKGVYHCFGCGKSGNVFTFLMEKENMSFFEAAKFIAEKYNIKLEFEEAQYDGDRNLIESLYEIHSIAGRYFYENLTSRAGELALAYLGSRNIKDNTIKKFGLGYSLREKDTLYKYLSAKFSNDILITSGLIINAGSKEIRDRFRGRLMFPVFNESGKVIAFAGRIITHSDNFNEAKYINSPETPIYNKSRTLYGLNFSRNHIKQSGYVIIVEGYMDLISLYQNEILNVVAVSGTSLTNLHAKILSRYTNEAVILFDSDKAGESASRRAIELLIENGISVKIASLPSGEDPDSYISKYGMGKFTDVINKRKSVIDFIASEYSRTGKLESPEGKTEFIREILGIISKIRDVIQRDFYIKDISRKFGIYESLIRGELDKFLRSKAKGITRKDNAHIIISQPKPALNKTELNLIAIIIHSDKNTLNYIMQNLETDMIESQEAKKIINTLLVIAEKKKEINQSQLFVIFNDDISRNIIEKALFESEHILLNKDRTAYAKSVINLLKLQLLKKKINNVNKKIQTADINSPDTTEWLKERQRLMVEENNLRKSLKTG